jgi:hypothetical protein
VINLLNEVPQIQGVLDREHAIAKAQLAAGQQDRALIALRRRKYQHSLLTKTEEQLETLEHLVCLLFQAKAPPNKFRFLLLNSL